ncbi:MAG: Hsp20/alpha crystallin family protein [Candidatus Methanospirareceae archaeon]
MIEKATWGYDGNLEPLYEVEEREDEFLVTFDLPRVRREDVEVNTTKDTVEVVARMSRAICWEHWGSVQRKITFQAFRKRIRLPEQVEPEKASAIFKKGILQINLPKARRKVVVPIT